MRLLLPKYGKRRIFYHTKNKEPIMLVIFVVFVLVYLTLESAYFFVAMPHHRKHLARIQGFASENELAFTFFPYGVLAYVVLVATIWVLVLDHGRFLQRQQSRAIIKDIAINASCYGLAVYGVYNLTNMAAFSRYNLKVALIDTAWGVFVINAACLITFTVSRFFASASSKIDDSRFFR